MILMIALIISEKIYVLYTLYVALFRSMLQYPIILTMSQRPIVCHKIKYITS